MHYATSNRKIQAVQLLLDFGADATITSLVSNSCHSTDLPHMTLCGRTHRLEIPLSSSPKNWAIMISLTYWPQKLASQQVYDCCESLLCMRPVVSPARVLTSRVMLWHRPKGSSIPRMAAIHWSRGLYIRLLQGGI